MQARMYINLNWVLRYNCVWVNTSIVQQRIDILHTNERLFKFFKLDFFFSSTIHAAKDAVYEGIKLVFSQRNFIFSPNKELIYRWAGRRGRKKGERKNCNLRTNEQHFFQILSRHHGASGIIQIKDHCTREWEWKREENVLILRNFLSVLLDWRSSNPQRKSRKLMASISKPSAPKGIILDALFICQYISIKQLN